MIEKMMNKMGWVSAERYNLSKQSDAFAMAAWCDTITLLSKAEGQIDVLEAIVYEARTKRDSKGRFRKTKNLAKLLLQYEAKYK